MQAYIDVLNLLARWAHVALAITWLGAAVYFAWRDRLDPHDAGARFGEQAVMWEAYGAWLTGFALLVLVYYANAELYLVDPAVMPLSKGMAIAASGAVLIGVLAAYEALCRAPLGEGTLLVAMVVLLAATAWGLTHLFSGRGAFLHYGAILGTIMAGNVAHVTIPARRRWQQALSEGRAPDAKDAWRARQRLVHNVELLPAVVLAMISTHYPTAFMSRWAWLILVLATLAGMLLRRGRMAALLGGACALAVAVLALPARERGAATAGLEDATPIIQRHCAVCHAQTPTFRGIGEPPKGVMLDTPERIRAQAKAIRDQAVVTRAMPPGNVTRMDDREREVLERWSRSAR